MASPRGFIALPLSGYIALGAGAIILALGLALKIQSARLDAAQHEKAKIQAEYEVFKDGVRKAGEAQKAKNDQLLKEREKINATALKTLQNRYSSLDARYQRLRQSAGHSSASPMPAVPDTARPVDDAARDSRLLEVLRAADQQTAQLIELQKWVRAQR